MVSITTDPQNPDKLFLTATVSLYIDRLLIEALSDEIKRRITWQASRDIKNNPEVKKQIAKAASKKLLQMLELPDAEDPDVTVSILGKESVKGDAPSEREPYAYPKAEIKKLEDAPVYREGPPKGAVISTHKGPMSEGIID